MWHITVYPNEYIAIAHDDTSDKYYTLKADSNDWTPVNLLDTKVARMAFSKLVNDKSKEGGIDLEGRNRQHAYDEAMNYL